ncbi:MAG TPA: hypothetical protein VMH36_13115 [Alphaproteobacteria bacterium]|nr:hypothetical protein [Alphaproteobacteria bacterium]
MRRQIFAAVALAGLALAGCGGGQPMATEPAHKVVDTSIGKVLATNRGMTLYTFAKDTTPGLSNCNDRCAANWPPLIALDDAKPVGKWTVLRRADGMMQWAYDGKPLYGWHEDKQQGDTGGDGQLDGAWKAARP